MINENSKIVVNKCIPTNQEYFTLKIEDIFRIYDYIEIDSSRKF